MTKYEAIKCYEDGIKVLQASIQKLINTPDKQKTVKRGDFIICTDSSEWAYSKGERMWVDSVADGRIYARSANPKYRKNGIFWVSNSDWVKDE